MLLSSLSDCYSSINNVLLSNIFLTVEAMMRCCSANGSKIALALSQIKNTSFKASDMAIYRLISNAKFQVDDKLWRCYLGMVFKMLCESDRLKKGDKIYIKVDFTSDTDDFLILFASIVISGKAIPLYFTMRSYPKRKNSYDHKKMELAFLKALKHILSSKYQYVIVADRGFGNNRFIGCCEECGFEYVIRIQPNISIQCSGKSGILGEVVDTSGKFNVFIKNWKRNLYIFKNELDGNEWYLASNIKEISHNDAIGIYKNRFKIEKIFQDLKSSGFDIENIKIKKYDRFKRMLFLCCFSYAIMVMLGDFIERKLPDIKKNSPIFINLLTANFVLPQRYCRNIPTAHTQS